MHKISRVIAGLQSRERGLVIESLTQGNASKCMGTGFRSALLRRVSNERSALKGKQWRNTLVQSLRPNGTTFHRQNGRGF
jgi:hypothetical protein